MGSEQIIRFFHAVLWGSWLKAVMDVRSLVSEECSTGDGQAMEDKALEGL